MKKLIGVGIIILLISMSIPSTVSIVHKSTASFNGNTLYVGGIGLGNYTKIQDAIDNASDGDTVFVYNDSSPYFEEIIMDKSLNLIGEDNYSTCISGWNMGDVIHVIADGVNISRFRVRNCGEEYAGIKIVSDNNVIFNNNFSKNFGPAIILENSSFNTIQNNILIDNDYCQILLRNSSNNVIQKNILNRSEDWYCINGIWLVKSSNNIIKENTIKNISYIVGINIYNSSNNNTIQENIFCCNGMLDSNTIQVSDSDFNTIIDNKLHRNDKGDGIVLFFSSNNKILKNTIVEIHDTGIGIAASEYNLVKGNKISSNGIGISIAIASYLNTIELNNILNNKIGVRLRDYLIDPHVIGNCKLNKIKNNNFIGNTQQAYDNELFALNMWHGNYWNKPRIFPKVIFGKREIGNRIIIPVIHFDFNPAKEPFIF